MLNIYRGRETVDKEKFIYGKIKELGGRNLVLVPDQYTLVAEKQALSRLGAKVLLDIEILSLSRLGSRLLAESGSDKKTVINRYGRHMLISKILRDENESLDAFKGMWGRENFVAAVNDFISNAKQYEVSPEEISELLIKKVGDGASDGSGNGANALQRKLRDINFVYEKYEDALEGKYTDAEDLISMYEEAARESNLIASSNIWIYGFDSFTPKNLSFIAALIARAKSVNVFLTWDKNVRDEDLFRLSAAVSGELVGVAEEVGSHCSIIDLGEDDQKRYAATQRAPGIASAQAFPDFLNFRGNFRGVQGAQRVAGAQALGGFVIPVLIIQGFQGVLQLGDLFQHAFPLPIDEGQALGDGIVPLEAPVHEFTDFPNGHAGFLQALNDGKPGRVAFLEHAHAAAGAFYKGQQAFLIIIAQSRGRASSFFAISLTV